MPQLNTTLVLADRAEACALVRVEAQVEQQPHNLDAVVPRRHRQAPAEVLDRVFKWSLGSACAEPLDIAACRSGVEVACAARNGIAGLPFRGARLLVWPFVLLDDGHDVRKPTLTRERQRAGRLPIRIDAAMRVGAVCHEDAHHLDVAIDDGVVQRADVVRALVREFGPQAQHRADTTQIARADGVGEALDGDALDRRFQLGPALEAVGACDHELRVVERERRRLGAVVMRGDFSDGRTVPADEAIEQLLRLTSELPEIRMWRKRASRKGACGHDELLSGHRLRGCRGARCPLTRAEKSSSTCWIVEPHIRWTLSFPRTRRRPDAQGQV